MRGETPRSNPEAKEPEKQESLKAKFRRLSLLIHPDRTKGIGAAFKELSEAQEQVVAERPEKLMDFEVAYEEEIKKEFDPLYWALINDIKLEPLQAGKINFKYISIENLKKGEGKSLVGDEVVFSNYHDFKTYLQGLTDEERSMLKAADWGSSLSSSGKKAFPRPSVIATNFWDRLQDEGGDLRAHERKFMDFLEEALDGRLADTYAQIAKSGKLGPKIKKKVEEQEKN